MEKIIVIGDLHGKWSGINHLIATQQPSHIFQCGDFGWWPKYHKNMYVESDTEKWSQYGIDFDNTEVMFCDGNHEQHDSLKEWRDQYFGTKKIPLIKNKLFYMRRGSVVELPDGRTVCFIGGADSIDKNSRYLGINWFKEELLSYYEIEHIFQLYDKIDIFVTHTAPFDVLYNIVKDIYLVDPSTKVLNEVFYHFKPKQWYFAHWHTFKEFEQNGTKFTCLDKYDKLTQQSKWWTELKL